MSTERLKVIINPEADKIVAELIDKYCYEHSLLTSSAIMTMESLLRDIITCTISQDHEHLKQDYLKLTELSISQNVPYVVLANELEFIKNSVITLLLDKNAKEEVYEICSLYQNCSNTIAHVYLQDYLLKLAAKNTKRLTQLNELLEKEIVTFYEAHLHWLNQLVTSIQELDYAQVPETDSKKCLLGKWLTDKGEKTIDDPGVFKNLTELHDALHTLSHKIEKKLHHDNFDYHIFMSYLEKAELLSLDIGTHMALIDSQIMITKSSKDILTGTINRNAMEPIFFNQYELAFATEKPFILAMCDMDDFKQINDTYGHVAGDNILKMFASVATQNLRSADIIIRYGGEEFLIILPAVSYFMGVQILESIRTAIENTSISYNGHEISTTISIGMIEIVPPDDIKDHEIHIERYIEAADEKLYLAKHAGKNCLK